MVARVAGHLEHPQVPPQQGQVIAPLDALGLQWDPLAIRGAGDHRRLGPALQQPRGSTDVVVVVMGVQDRLELQAPLLQPGDHGLGHRRIHHGGTAAATVQDKDVVVAQDRDQRNRRGGMHR